MENNTGEWASPIHQDDDGKWRYWDESWQYESSPFDTKEECETALQKYSDFLDGITIEYTDMEDQGEN